MAPLYRTAPLSPIPQPDFFNSVVAARSDLPAADLLGLAKALEHDAGRTAGPRDGPRPLDVDLLLVGDLVIESASLTLPHPAMRRRRFVLRPLADLAPKLALPGDGTTVGKALARLPEDDGVEWVGWARAPGIASGRC